MSDTKTCLSNMYEVLIKYGGEGGRRRLNYMRNDGSFAWRLVDHCSEIRVMLSEVLKISIQDIIKA